ncbi:hypothetical protein HPB47_003636, partial [Ixodes persulcatus]
MVAGGRDCGRDRKTVRCLVPGRRRGAISASPFATKRRNSSWDPQGRKSHWVVIGRRMNSAWYPRANQGENTYATVNQLCTRDAIPDVNVTRCSADLKPRKETRRGLATPTQTAVHLRLVSISLFLGELAPLLCKDGALIVHENIKHHKEAMQAGKDFLACVRHLENDLANQICSQRLQQVKENRRRLVPIVESIIFLGRQNIAFRGHRDDGALLQRENEGSLASNKGNFRELFASGYQAVTPHFMSTSSVLYRELHKARKDFVQFVDPRDDAEGSDSCTAEPALTGKVLEKVVQMLRNLGLDLEKCVGIAIDGCCVMTSELWGAINETRQQAPNAVHCLRFNHALNLSLSKSTRVKAVRNAAGTMKEVISFFTASSKRSKALKDALGNQLKGLCETRWVDRHDSVIQFRHSLPSVCEALDVVAKWQETKTAANAKILHVALSDDEFKVSIVCLSDLLANTLPLSRLFQKECVDIHETRNALGDTVEVLADRRSHGQETFVPLYEQAVVLADALDADILPPCVTIRQTYRLNVSNSDPEECYRQSVYLQLLDNVLEDLKSRLSNEALSVHSLSVFTPSFRRSTAEEDYITEIADLAERYCSYVGHEATTVKELIGAELRLWKAKWKRESEGGATVPSTAIGALGMCDDEVYPSFKRFLHLLDTLLMSVASAQRSLSTLRRLKPWLRSDMGETRLTDLALLNIHRDITMNNES